ncbi:MAG: transglutaminase-like enzyme [Nitrospinae bacterium]|jgi:transglutaminase-like putative cysteine protease|nr:transglutaminase-like enzyme [Nitrospinota bacterium]
MELDEYLKSGKYADSDSPLVAEKARELAEGCESDAEKAVRIHAYVRDLTFDIAGGFRMLLDGKGKASDFIREGRGFCMHKAAAFAALCRAAGVPARIGFEIVDCPDKPFLPEKMRKVYGTRPQPWHSVGEVYLNGGWVVADCTVDREQGERTGRPVPDFDGVHDLATTEGPVLNRRGSSPDMPDAVVERHKRAAAAFFKHMASDEPPALLPDNIIVGETEDVALTPPEK